MPTWPAGLPQRVLVEGYDEGARDTVIRSTVDAGPAKTRRRYTAGPRPLRVAVEMTRAQLDTFTAFHGTDLADGALSFTFPDPRSTSGGTLTVRFTRPPSWTPRPGGGAWWVVAMELEVMP